MPQRSNERNIITDSLVLPRTGHTLEHWFELLDKKGARHMTQKEIYTLISRIPGLGELGEWNQNLMATSYGWSRNLWQKGKRDDGFEVSVSKTVNVTTRTLYAAFTDESSRNNWLGPEKVLFRKSTKGRSCRVTWSDGTSLSVEFYPKGPQKSQVVVQHQKLYSPQLREARKVFWTEKLDRLKKMLEV